MTATEAQLRASLTPDQRRLLQMVENEEKRLKARECFQTFLEYMMPDPQAYLDATRTRYVSKPVHKLMVKWWEELDNGTSLRSALSVPPQTGKTTHTSIMGCAWTLGRRPDVKIMVGTYNESKAKQNGSEIRRVLNHSRYAEVFPEVNLEKGGKSKSFLSTDVGGYILMAGRGTGITGMPCDIFVVDDPIKDHQEATSTNALEEAWEWFSITAQQRAHNLTRFGILHTRWADNDLIGRLCDPQHPNYDPVRAAPWTWLNIKAYDNEPHIAEIMGIEPQDYIWPEKFNEKLLGQIKMTMLPEAFSALYMGRPVPEEGGFFRKDMIQVYQPGERPQLKDLRVYAASDHALSTKTHGNYTVLIVAGVDKAGQVWLLDLVREKMPTDKTVEEMIRLMKLWRPLTWFAAKDQISGSIGPFLKNRMRTEGVYVTHVEDSPEIGNKMQKAQAIRGMMALGLVRFPVRAGWHSPLVNELLRFRGEGDAQDDQIDAMGHLGRGLERMARRTPTGAANDVRAPSFGTYAWLQGDLAAKKAQEATDRSRNTWQ